MLLRRRHGSVDSSDILGARSLVILWITFQQSLLCTCRAEQNGLKALHTSFKSETRLCDHSEVKVSQRSQILGSLWCYIIIVQEWERKCQHQTMHLADFAVRLQNGREVTALFFISPSLY